MKFETSFDKTIFQEKMRLYFYLVWKNSLKSTLLRLVVLILILIVPSFFLLIGKGGKQLYILILIMLVGIIYSLNFLRIYHAEKRKYFNDLDKEIKNAEQIKVYNVWEFEEDYFKLKTYKSESVIQWEEFKSFRETEETIFLDLKSSFNMCYVLSAKEIGTSNYKKVISFLEQKLKKSSANP